MRALVTLSRTLDGVSSIAEFEWSPICGRVYESDFAVDELVRINENCFTLNFVFER